MVGKTVKYNVIFTDNVSKLDWFATNILEFDLDFIPSPHYKLSYTLNDNYLTKEFIKTFVNIQNSNVTESGKPSYNYNYYYNPTVKHFIKAKSEMNKVIDDLNELYKTTNFFNIDNSLKLDLETHDPEYDKINELHFIFEKEVIKLRLGDPNETQTWYLLEKVNNLVHFIERGVSNVNDIDFNYFMISLRTHGGLEHFYTLKADDYKEFKMPAPGDLVADYSTVGKDLHAAAITNDLELVKKQELKQQEYITGYAFMPFNYGQNNFDLVDGYYRWLYKHDIIKYVNWTEPKYIPGRHVLGKVDNSFESINDFYQTVLSKTPYLASVFISKDNGEILTSVDEL